VSDTRRPPVRRGGLHALDRPRPEPDQDAVPHIARGALGHRLRVLVLGQEQIVRLGFRAVLVEQQWVERCIGAESPDQAAQVAARYRPHVVLVSLPDSEPRALELAQAVIEAAPDARVLLMTGGHRISARVARSIGAVGVVPRSWPVGELVMALRMVGMGMTIFPEVPEPPRQLLSPGEQEVLELIAAGATNADIGGLLYLSVNTVKQRASTAYRKLGARNRAEAVQRAERLGLIA
jgi:two-component system response regulator DesR